MKYAVLSTDANPDYYSLLPLVCYSWRKIGYEPVIICVNAEHIVPLLEAHTDALVYNESGRAGIRDSTIAQVMRLFASELYLVQSDFVLVTADADMVIAKDIFHCNEGFTNYGYDLTGRSELPICYNIATAAKWRELMGEFTIPPKAYSDKWEDYWSVDQQLLTQRAHEYGMGKITFVDRLHNHPRGLPTGRWDRYCWDVIPDDIIDVHMKRNDWDAQIQVFQRLWPGEDYSFILKFKEALDGIDS